MEVNAFLFSNQKICIVVPCAERKYKNRLNVGTQVKLIQNELEIRIQLINSSYLHNSLYNTLRSASSTQ